MKWIVEIGICRNIWNADRPFVISILVASIPPAFPEAKWKDKKRFPMFQKLLSRVLCQHVVVHRYHGHRRTGGVSDITTRCAHAIYMRRVCQVSFVKFCVCILVNVAIQGEMLFVVDWLLFIFDMSIRICLYTEA